MAPLGYDTKDRKITVNQVEADCVRLIFRRYLKLGSLNLLMADLRSRGIVTKVRKLKGGGTAGGIPFTRGSLAHLLRNRFYVGKVSFKGEVLQGEQLAIVDCRIFNAVQAKLDRQVNSFKAVRQRSGALLTGRLYDDRGNRMSPSHTVRRGIKYRYYLSSALLQGQAKRAGSVPRAPAAAIETMVLKSVREHLKLAEPIDDRNLVNAQIVRVIMEPERLVITLAPFQKPGRQLKKGRNVLHVPWNKTPSTRRREILQPSTSETNGVRPIRSETRATLIASIARGRRWLDELATDPSATSERIAARENCSVRKVNMTISLALLAPGLVKAAIDGRLPRGMGVARLCDMPAEWSRQYQALGLASP
jgi:site-specific DNA recombinase